MEMNGELAFYLKGNDGGIKESNGKLVQLQSISHPVLNMRGHYWLKIHEIVRWVYF